MQEKKIVQGFEKQSFIIDIIYNNSNLALLDLFLLQIFGRKFFIKGVEGILLFSIFENTMVFVGYYSATVLEIA